MCYHFLKERLSWVDARDECNLRAGWFGEHGDLASINSVQEQTFVHS